MKLEDIEKGKNYTPAEILARMKELEEKHGPKFVVARFEDMKTEENQKDKMEYDVLSQVLSEATPELKKAINNYKKAAGTEVFIKSTYGKVKTIFWPLLGVLLLLAVIKYLLS
jgi:hypothetical protein